MNEFQDRSDGRGRIRVRFHMPLSVYAGGSSVAGGHFRSPSKDGTDPSIANLTAEPFLQTM